MQLFECPTCSATLFFDSLVCGTCETEVGYAPASTSIVPSNHPCANRPTIACNWQVETPQTAHCASCALTTIVPDIAASNNIELWSKSELAKRWVLANLSEWHWFDANDLGPKPEFHLLAELTQLGRNRITMGHDDGLVTINVAEADSVVQTARREQFNEPYRTMVGHFRHELAHYMFFKRFSPQPGFLDEFHALMGDETIDYGEAMSHYYANGCAPDWQQAYVSQYAASHPHEDFAETFAHLLHLTDIADTFISVGFSSIDIAEKNFEPYQTRNAAQLLSFAAELTIGLNQLNRSMGLDDIYPFVLTPLVRSKIEFVHKWVSAGPSPAERRD